MKYVFHRRLCEYYPITVMNNFQIRLHAIRLIMYCFCYGTTILDICSILFAEWNVAASSVQPPTIDTIRWRLISRMHFIHSE